MSASTPQEIIYLDYAATTPADPAVIEAMLGALGLASDFGNPASIHHGIGRRAREHVENARDQIADLVHAPSETIIFTSGATESDNLALSGVMSHGASAGHLIVSAIEHKAVLDTARYLESRGMAVTRLKPDKTGRISPDCLASAMRTDTRLVSIMHVNNEIGVIEDIEALGAVCRERGVLFHVDAAQSAGKIPINLESLPVDLMSFSGHKIYGPKGIGALYVARAVRPCLEALIHGGGHEHGLRSGTLATHQIVGMGKAFSIAGSCLGEDAEKARMLSRALERGLKESTAVHINGPEEALRSPYILNVSFEGVVADSLLYFLTDVAVSTGSACSSESTEASYVLKALGYSDQRAKSSLRFSLGRGTSIQHVNRAVKHVAQAVDQLRRIAPKECLKAG